MNTSSLRINPWLSLSSRAPGLILCGLIAAAAIALGGVPWFVTHGLSALTLAIVFGMVLGNSVYPSVGALCGAGVAVSKQTLLRAGVVLYGLRLTVQDIGHVGIAGMLIDVCMIASTFGLATFVGIRWLKMDRRTAMLIGAGSAICGAAAVMATEPAVRARAEQVTVAVATVVVFGTLAIFVYPVLFALNQVWGVLTDAGFGVYAGSSIHEVAQVVAATRPLGDEVAGAAVIAKMVRVMLLAPFLLFLSARLARGERSATRTRSAWRAVPLFALGFIAVVLFNSLHLLPKSVVDALLLVDTFLLAMAMAALGFSTRVSAVRQAGTKPLLLASMLAVWLIMGGALINVGVDHLFG